MKILPNSYQPSVLQVLEAVDWFRSLYEVASSSLGTQEAGSLLSLHWKWAHRRGLIKCIPDIRYIIIL